MKEPCLLPGTNVSQGPLDTLGEAEYRQTVGRVLFSRIQRWSPMTAEQIATDILALYHQQARTPCHLATVCHLGPISPSPATAAYKAATFAGNDMNTFQYWFRDEDAPTPVLVPTAIYPVREGPSHAKANPYVLYRPSS